MYALLLLSRTIYGNGLFVSIKMSMTTVPSNTYFKMVKGLAVTTLSMYVLNMYK